MKPYLVRFTMHATTWTPHPSGSTLADPMPTHRPTGKVLDCVVWAENERKAEAVGRHCMADRGIFTVRVKRLRKNSWMLRNLDQQEVSARTTFPPFGFDTAPTPPTSHPDFLATNPLRRNRNA